MSNTKTITITGDAELIDKLKNVASSLNVSPAVVLSSLLLNSTS